MSISRGMDGEDMVHMYNEILLTYEKEQNNAPCSNVNRPGNRQLSGQREKDKYMILLIRGIFKKKWRESTYLQNIN